MTEKPTDTLAPAEGILNGIIISVIIFWLPACVIAAIIWGLL